MAIGTPCIGQPEPAWQPLEQAYLQGGLQPTHLLGNGRLGYANFFGREAKVEVTGHHFKHPQCVERWQFRETDRHGVSIWG